MTNHMGRQFGNYRLTSLLGKGGFAEVYLGQHLYLQKQVAIKVLHEHILIEKGIAQLQQEADILVNLIHPHIVKVLDFSVENTIPFLWHIDIATKMYACKMLICINYHL